MIPTGWADFNGLVTLTASPAPTLEEIAGIAAGLTGRPITRLLVEPEEFVAAQVAVGQPEFVARVTVGMYRAAQQGFVAGTDPQLSEQLGRVPRTVAQELAQPTSP